MAGKEPSATERELELLLERRHAGAGNGGAGEYAFLTQVRNDGGFSATRTFDAVAVALWPSRGYAIDVFEIKVSRSDWLRELKDPAKSEAAWQIGNRFWIVATAGIVQPGELPPGWGLIEAYGAKVTGDGLTGRRLRTVTAAEFRGGKVGEVAKQPISKGLLVAMLRRAGAVPDRLTVDQRALERVKAEARQEAMDTWEGMVNGAREEHRAIVTQVRRFEQLSGVPVLASAYSHGPQPEGIDATARRIREALADEGHAERVRQRLVKMRNELQHGVEQIDTLLTTTDRPALGGVV